MEAGTIKYKFTNESFEKMIDEIVMEPDSAKASLDCCLLATQSVDKQGVLARSQAQRSLAALEQTKGSFASCEGG